MTQNNERELIERLALVVIDLRRSHNGFDFIASLSELEAFAKAYKVAIDANDKSPISQNEQQEAVDLNDLAGRQADWLKTMGWWKNKTPLESLMLVVSECGEAANEVRGKEPTEHFKTELADIILRTLGIAAENDINIQQAVMDKMAKNKELKPNTNRVK